MANFCALIFSNELKLTPVDRIFNKMKCCQKYSKKETLEENANEPNQTKFENTQNINLKIIPSADDQVYSF